MADRTLLIEWLNEAYVMENAIAGVLEAQLAQGDAPRDLQEKIREHIATTRQQAERLRDHITSLGGMPAALTATAANAFGSFQGSMTGALPNTLVRNGVLNYATEHFEVGTYTAIIAAAKVLDEDTTVRLCEEILKEEEEMARWLHRHLPKLVDLSIGEPAASHSR